MSDNNSPTVSVCIPVFNGGEFIQECIQSVLSQNFEDFELLIVDNTSTDNTIEVCTAFSDERILIHKGSVNIGSHRNMKRCFELASGELVMMLPCDDLLEPGCLSVLATPMISDSHVGLAFGRTKVINSKGDTLFEPHFEESGLLNSEQALNFIVKNFNPIQHPLVRRSSYFQQGGFREKYGCFMDIHLWTRIAWFSDALYLAAGSITCIRQHSAQGQNIVSNMSTDNLAILATYFGKRSLKQLQYRVGYNLCLLRVVKFLEQIEARGDMTSKNFVLMLSKLIKSNIFHMIKALLHRNADQINLEMAVYRRINKQFKKNLIFKIYAKEVSSLFYQLPLRVGKLLMKNFHRKSNRLKTNF